MPYEIGTKVVCFCPPWYDMREVCTVIAYDPEKKQYRLEDDDAVRFWLSEENVEKRA